MKLLLIVLLIAVIAVVGLLAARSRARSSEALAAEDHRDAITPGMPDETVIAPPPADITTSAMAESPLPEPDPVVEPLPEPDPIVEPEPPMEPEPIIEPEPQPAESLATDPDEPTDPPQAVIDAGELPAQELDPHAGWETDEDRTIHADPESGLYHTPDSPGYKIGPDGQVFETEEEAQSAGFTRWDQPDQPS